MAVGLGVRVLVGVSLGTGVEVANNSAGDEQDKIERINIAAIPPKEIFLMFFTEPSRMNVLCGHYNPPAGMRHT